MYDMADYISVNVKPYDEGDTDSSSDHVWILIAW